MNVSLYPLMSMTWCFIQPPPPESVCNCSEPPPQFDIKFPVYPTTAGPSTETTTDSIGTSTHELETTTTTLYTGSVETTSPSTETNTAYTTVPSGPSSSDPMLSVMTTSNSGGGIQTDTTSDTPITPSAAPVTDDSMSSVAMVTELETMSAEVRTMVTEIETMATDMKTMATYMTTSDPNGNDIWPVIVAVIFGVVLVACIVAFIIWWMKKYGILAQCKVHPDAMHDEEKMTPDTTEINTLSTDKPPPPSSPPAPVAAVGAVGTGASPTKVKKIHKKGSVELKPIGKPLPPIKKSSVILEPSNLTEPETDHPHAVVNSNSNNASSTKPKKKKRKKKKKLSGSNEMDIGDTNMGYENTENLPDG